MSKSRLSVRNYGLHWATGGIPILEEQSGGRCLWDANIPSPFEVRPDYPGLRCPHLLNGVTATAEPLPKGFEILAPQINGGAFFVRTFTANQLLSVSKLHNAQTPIVFPVWSRKFSRLVEELNLTNITPLILVGATPKYYAELDKFLQVPRVRTIFVSADHCRPGLTEIELPDISPRDDLKNVGAYYLNENVKTRPN